MGTDHYLEKHIQMKPEDRMKIKSLKDDSIKFLYQ